MAGVAALGATVTGQTVALGNTFADFSNFGISVGAYTSAIYGNSYAVGYVVGTIAPPGSIWVYAPSNCTGVGTVSLVCRYFVPFRIV